MAEAVAGFYAVETAVEASVVAAVATSRPTVPLIVSFRKLKLPSKAPETRVFKATINHTLSIVDGKGYIFGGDTEDGTQDASIKVIALPTSPDVDEVDIQIIEPEAAQDRPLQAYSDSTLTQEAEKSLANLSLSNDPNVQCSNEIPNPRAAHASTTIGPDIYILGGRNPRSLSPPPSTKPNQHTNLYPLDIIHVFSTQTQKWSTIHATPSSTSTSIPIPRTHASVTSHPTPSSSDSIAITPDRNGTLILHGGYDSSDTLLRDTWALDVASGVWTRWPSIPNASEDEIPGEGRIICRSTTLCRVGDGFGKVQALSLRPVHSPSVTSSQVTSLEPTSPSWSTQLTTNEILAASTASSLPLPRRSAGFLPVTTGSGRYYNLYFMGQDGPDNYLDDIWSFQVRPDDVSFAAAKDGMRNLVGKKTGEGEWCMCEVVESDKVNGPREVPSGLVGFAADKWENRGGGAGGGGGDTIVLWGGRKEGVDGEVVAEGWVMNVRGP